jgi:hypothetical protein
MNTEKKQWVTPTEIEVNNGGIPYVFERGPFRSTS